MTLLRKLADKISAVVVRRSSPATKDWAAATAQELPFIQNDWAALRWSLGSARLLLQQRCACDVHLTALAEVPSAAERLTKETIARARAMCLVAVIEVAVFARSLAHLHNPVRRTGCLLMIASILYLALQAIVRRGRRMPSDADLPAQTAHFRSELERERRYHSGLWLWSRLIFVFGAMLVLMVAGSIAPPTHIYLAVFWLAFIGVFIPLAIHGNYRKGAQFRRRIVELDTIERGAA
jgi:hypothetical protein